MTDAGAAQQQQPAVSESTGISACITSQYGITNSTDMNFRTTTTNCNNILIYAVQ
jgi:hypothetical protein